VTSVGAGAALLAGCTSGGGAGEEGDDGAGGTDSGGVDTTETSDASVSGGRFRLLISDRPAAIGDFESLTVSFSHARVFGDVATETATATGTATTAANETGGGAVQPESDDGDEDDPGNGNGNGRGNGDGGDGGDGDEDSRDTAATDDRDAGEAGDDGEGGFTRFDLSGASVDLTKVVGDRAMPVLDETLAPGRYTKIELHAADVTGIVDGEGANVKIPSGKLMLTKPFEVRRGESVSFVFDINVVQRGQGNDYNLLPVIGESGVAGTDVAVEEVDDAGTATTTGTAVEDTTNTTAENATTASED